MTRIGYIRYISGCGSRECGEIDRLGEVDQLILKIYDTVADQSSWPAVLDELARMVSARGCMMFDWEYSELGRELKSPHYSASYDNYRITQYLTYFREFETQDQDVFERCSLKSDRIDLIEDDVLATTDAELFERPNVQQLLKFGIKHRAAGLLDKDNTSRSRFSIQLGAERGRLTNEEKTILSKILPHISKSLELGRPAAQLAARRHNMLAMLDQLTIGVAFLDSDHRVIEVNEELKRQIDELEIISISHYGYLTLKDNQKQRLLIDLLTDASQHGKFGARPRKEAIETSHNGYLCIEAVPVEKLSELGTKQFNGHIVFSTDTNRPISVQQTLIKHVFKLTEIEASLVDMVCQGLTNVQMAEIRGRSVDTVNNQIKSVFYKTNCQSRTELVRLAMNFGVNFLKS